MRALASNAFKNCTSLLIIKIPSCISFMSAYSFGGCMSLKKAVLNEGMQMIHNESFGEFSTLISITIPSSVTSIALNTFKGSN